MVKTIRKIFISSFILLSSIFYAQDGHTDTIVSSNGNKHLNKVIEYPGSLLGLNKDFGAAYVFPKKAVMDKVHGQILIEFTIDTLGKAVSPFILKGVRADVDSAALKAVKKLKRFKPALLDGRKVSQKMNMPLSL